MDPPGKTQQMTFPELLAVMDGLGIAVTAGPSSAIELRAGGWLAALAGLVGIIATIALTRKLVPSLSTKPWAGPAWIVVVGIAWMFLHVLKVFGRFGRRDHRDRRELRSREVKAVREVVGARVRF